VERRRGAETAAMKTAAAEAAAMETSTVETSTVEATAATMETTTTMAATAAVTAANLDHRSIACGFRCRRSAGTSERERLGALLWAGDENEDRRSRKTQTADNAASVKYRHG
jgi:hypothetical protein